MWAPRLRDRGNWVHMVGVRTPLPPPKQRPPPRQAVRDVEPIPHNHYSDSLERLIQLLLCWMCVCFFSFLCIDLKRLHVELQSCARLSSLDLCLYTSVRLWWIHVSSERSSLWRPPLWGLPLLCPFTFFSLVLLSELWGYKPCWLHCGLCRQPAAPQLILRRLTDLFWLWSAFPTSARLVCQLAAVESFLSLF